MTLVGKAHTSSAKEVLRKLPIGRVLSYEGETYVNEVRVESQVPIYLGSSMSTKNGSLHMAFGRETLINLSNNSKFQIVQIASKGESQTFSIAGMLVEGKIQGHSVVNKDGTQSPISILSPRGELIVRGGRFSIEVSQGKDIVRFVSLDRASQLAIFAPKELIDKHPLVASPNEKDTGSLGIGLVSRTEVSDLIKEHRTLNLKPMQVAQMDFSQGFGSLAIASMAEKLNIEKYHSKFAIPFQEERIFPTDRVVSAKFKNTDILNLIPNFDQVVILNFSKVNLTLDL